MKTYLPLLAVLLACTTFGPQARGQTVYKCGTVYSQQPCPGAVTLDASDSRTPAQKAQTDAAAAQAATTAAKMEKDRLALEKAAAVQPSGKPPRASQIAKTDASAATKTSAKKKKKEAEYFTAAVAPEKKAKKTKKPDKKSGGKTPIAKEDTTEQPAKP